MPTWSGEVKCLKCGYWQIPMNFCPSCGHAFGGVFTATYSPTPLALDLALPPAKDNVYKIEWLDGDTVRLTPSQ